VGLLRRVLAPCIAVAVVGDVFVLALLPIPMLRDAARSKVTTYRSTLLGYACGALVGLTVGYRLTRALPDLAGSITRTFQWMLLPDGGPPAELDDVPALCNGPSLEVEVEGVGSGGVPSGPDAGALPPADVPDPGRELGPGHRP
jgi:hypothetical protein